MASEDSEFFRQLLRAYIDSANDGIFVVCDEMKFHVANPLLQAWLGLSEEVLTAHNERVPITDLIGNAFHAETFVQQFGKAMAGEPVRFQCWVTPANAAPRWLEISLNRVDLDAGALFIGIARDVTERKGLLEEVAYKATHDPLTELTNRQEFERQLDLVLRDPAGVHALLYLGLDNFKTVNDRGGHLAGNLFLQQLASRLLAKTRRSDTLSRLGGDEFGVILRHCPVETAVHLAQAYREIVRAFHFDEQGRRFEVSASVGVAPLSAGSGSLAETLGKAEAAYQVAKDRGGDRVQLYEGSEEFHRRRLESHWAAEVRAALAHDRFRLYWQDIVPLRARRRALPHREILLRLVMPSGEVVSPATFMPAAERYQLMPAVDRWVIHTLLARHLDRGAERTLWAVNLSGASLNDDGFLGFVRDEIASAAVSPDMLCFEITETVAIQNLQHAAAFIQEMKALGCRFALDDFGSGMSSFGYLRALPVDYLKIDGALVRDVSRDPISRAMVSAIQEVGRALGAGTIAEFAEDDGIIARLRQIGVDYAQGYGIHRPEPLG
ncbi:MAG: EAL domain-containing protein [Betaproteobacteria bacterium]|nr:EAL domain-containing protein [Betaproteobacteria bacterium]